MSCHIAREKAGMYVRMRGTLTPEDMVHRANALEACSDTVLTYCITDFLDVRDLQIDTMHMAFLHNLEFALALRHPTVRRVFIANTPSTFNLLDALLTEAHGWPPANICATEAAARASLTHH